MLFGFEIVSEIMQTDNFPILNLNNSVAIGSKYVLHCPQLSRCWIIPIPFSTFSLWFDNKGSWHRVGLESSLLIVLSLMCLPPPVTIYTLRSETFPCVHLCVGKVRPLAFIHYHTEANTAKWPNFSCSKLKFMKEIQWHTNQIQSLVMFTFLWYIK